MTCEVINESLVKIDGEYYKAIPDSIHKYISPVHCIPCRLKDYCHFIEYSNTIKPFRCSNIKRADGLNVYWKKTEIYTPSEEVLEAIEFLLK